MHPVSVRFLRLAVAAGLVLPALAPAQTARFDNTVIPVEFLETSPWVVSAGLRFSNQGAKVNFGQLGRINASQTLLPEGDVAQRSYSNGVIGVDGPRANETDAAGNVFTVPGGRYAGRQVDAFGNEFYVGDYIAYTPGQTRNYGFVSNDQVSNGRLALSVYSTESSGATAVSDDGPSGGFEVSVGRRLRRLGRRVEFGVTGLFGMNDIDAGTRGTVQANLVSVTDYYRMTGTPPATPRPYTGPTFSPLLDAQGNPVLANGVETTAPVSQTPQERTHGTVANGAEITGSWKINGAYYIVRVGPTVRIFVTDRLAFSFELGLAGAYVGTDYEVDEMVEVEGVPNPLRSTEESEEEALLAGFYGSGTVEYWMTDRTNAYAGAAYESLDNYQQSVGGRTAEIDIGSTITVRLGLTTRF